MKILTKRIGILFGAIASFIYILFNSGSDIRVFSFLICLIIIFSFFTALGFLFSYLLERILGPAWRQIKQEDQLPQDEGLSA